MKIITPTDLRSDIHDYLQGWFEKSKARQTAKGVKFELSFGDFLNLWGQRRIASLEKWMDDGSLFVRQRKSTKEDQNLNGYVLTFISFAESKTNVMTPQNAQICTRGKSLHDCSMKKGDTHTPESIAKISASTVGVPKTEEHKAAISASMKGKTKGPMSDEEKAKRSVSVKATLAKKKADADAVRQAAENAAWTRLAASQGKAGDKDWIEKP